MQDSLWLNLKLNWTHTWCGHPHLSPRHVSSRTTLRTPPALVSRLIIPPGSWPLAILQILYILLTCLTITHSHQHFISQPLKYPSFLRFSLLYVSCNNKLVQGTVVSKRSKESLSNPVAFTTEMMYCTSSGKANPCYEWISLASFLFFIYLSIYFVFCSSPLSQKLLTMDAYKRCFIILTFLHVQIINICSFQICLQWSFWETDFLWRICN